jgi:hypothetical protein
LARIALSCWLVLAIVSIPASASEYTANSTSSTALTDYLHTHRLPLVGAQVMESAEGERQVVLFGFVATAFGKTDAEAKARKFLKDSDITVDNRIKIRPELLSLKPTAPSSNAAVPPSSETARPSSAPPRVPSASSPPPEDLQAYQNQPGMNQFPMQQQFQQQNPDWASTVVPLIMMGAMIGLGALGGGSSFGLGGIPSFGSPSYGSPSGSPYGSSPYGSSPYGSSPYGSSPYNPPPSYSSPYP